MVKSCRKDCLTAEVLLEAKAAALHPRWYQSSLSKLSKVVGEAGKRSAGNRIGQPIRWTEEGQRVMDRQVIDRQVEDRQTSRDKADERWYPNRPCSVLNSGL